MKIKTEKENKIKKERYENDFENFQSVTKVENEDIMIREHSNITHSFLRINKPS